MLRLKVARGQRPGFPSATTVGAGAGAEVAPNSLHSAWTESTLPAANKHFAHAR